MLLRRLWFAVAVFACGMPLLVCAQDKPAEPAAVAKPEEGKPDEAKPEQSKPAADFGDLIRQLDSDKFADRQTAGQKLAEAGKAAIPDLSKAAQGDSREAATRAAEILKNHFKRGDEATKAAAKEALEKIAKEGNPAAARRAQEALNPKPENQPFPGGRQGIQVIPGQIQIQVQGGFGGPGGFKRVNMKNINGVKEIEVDDNGKKVKINDDPNNGIKVEVTEKNKEGKEETKKYEAKNADELKKNHPEGHKIYEEYSKQQNGIQIKGIQIQNGALPPGALPPGLVPPGFPGFPGAPLPVRIRPPRIVPAEEDQRQNEKIEAAQKRLDDAVQSLRKLAENNARADELNKVGDLIEAAKKQLDEAKAKSEIGPPKPLAPADNDPFG